jgi:ATP-dependent DNA helicase RecG
MHLKKEKRNMALKPHESQTTELKSSWRDEYMKILCAFANTDGGELIIGVDDKGKVKGIRNSKKLLEDLPNKIRNKLGITPLVNVRSKNRKKIIHIKIPPSSVPVSYDGKYYVRSGSTTQELKGSELIHFLLRKTGKTWDGLTCKANFSDIEISTIEDFKNLAKERIPGISKLDSTEKIFVNLKLLTDNGDMTNAGILLFGENPQRFFISAKTRLGRFKTSTEIIDTVIAEGNLFKQLEIVIDAIKKHLNVRFEIKGIQREDIWDYPIEALREAVINALIHKDYSSTAEIQIRIYDDRIWIWNPGGLPPQLTVEDLKREHSSYPRNPLIANAFYLAGFIERWGSGTRRIVDLCKEYGLPEPEYREEQGGFSVWFYKDIYTEENLRKMGLNERQIKAIMFTKQNGRITNTEYQTICNVKKRQATNDLLELEKIKILERVGTTGKGTYYILGHQRGKRGNKGASKGQKRPETRQKSGEE